MCVVASGTWEGKAVLIKNRDRNYKPRVRILHAIVRDVEVLVLHDEITGWCEGLNEHHLGVVNSALLVGRDEAEGQVIAQVRKRGNDGLRMMAALCQTNLKDMVKSLKTYRHGLRGHTFAANRKEVVALESVEKDVFRRKTFPMKEVHVRTNHGFFLENAGYTEGEDYISSKKRFEEAKGVLEGAEKISDLALGLMEGYAKDKKDGRTVVRVTPNMKTTSLMVLNLANLVAHLYLIESQITFLGYANLLPKEYTPKIRVRLYHLSGNNGEPRAERLDLPPYQGMREEIRLLKKPAPQGGGV